MIALDAAFLIAYLDRADAHHKAAHALLAAHADRSLVIGPLTKAETLVNPVRTGDLASALGNIEALGITEVPFPEDAAVRLAELRVQTGSKMPDCCVLLTAQQAGAAVATFDERLIRSAEALGLTVARAAR